jgi:iron complex outermembrane receptor protein
LDEPSLQIVPTGAALGESIDNQIRLTGGDAAATNTDQLFAPQQFMVGTSFDPASPFGAKAGGTPGSNYVISGSGIFPPSGTPSIGPVPLLHHQPPHRPHALGFRRHGIVRNSGGGRFNYASINLQDLIGTVWRRHTFSRFNDDWLAA